MTDHVAALEAMTDRPTAEAYVAGLRGGELDALVRDTGTAVIGRTVQAKRRALVERYVGRRADSLAISRVTFR